MSRLRFAVVGLLLGVLLALPAGVAAAKPATGTFAVPVTGSGAGGNSFQGQFALDRFTRTADGLAAVGTLTGTVTNATTGVVGTVSQQVTLPVAITAATCDILHLTLGPLDLNLLGLMIHLDQVVLNIDAQQGPGNLLGNLLCAVAGLLDNTGSSLSGITALLNQILGILQGL